MKCNVLRAKRCVAILVVLLMLLAFCGCGDKSKDKYPKPTEEFFVNDFADVITSDDEQTIYAQGVELQDKTKAQVVVVTIESLDGEEASFYAHELGNEWELGDEDKDSGIVILFSEDDEEIYIAVGEGLEGALPDSKTGRILDNYAMEHLSSGNFSKALVSVYNSVVNEIYIEYDMEPAEGYIPIATLPQGQQNVREEPGKILVSWIALIVIVLVYVLVFGKRGLFIFGAPRFFGGGFHFHGGSGGGSFGGFKGGGGSFGGGGAGRKF